MSYINVTEIRDSEVSTDGYATYTIDCGDLGCHDIEIDLDDYIDRFNVNGVDLDIDDIVKSVKREGELSTLIAELVISFGIDTILEHLIEEEEEAA